MVARGAPAPLHLPGLPASPCLSPALPASSPLSLLSHLWARMRQTPLPVAVWEGLFITPVTKEQSPAQGSLNTITSKLSLSLQK